MRDIAHDLAGLAAMNERLRTGIPPTFARKPAFAAFRKSDGALYEKQLQQEEIMRHYNLPAWRNDETWLADALDAFDAVADYPAAAKHDCTCRVQTAREALRTTLPRDAYCRFDELLRISDGFIDFPTRQRVEYFHVQADIMRKLPPIGIDINAVSKLTDAVETWGNRPSNMAMATPLPQLPRFHEALDKVLPRNQRNSIARLQRQRDEAYHHFEEELRRTENSSHVPFAQHAEAHEECKIAIDWGNAALSAYLRLWGEANEAACAIAPFVDIAIAYRNLLGPHELSRSAFLSADAMPFTDANGNESGSK